MNASFNDFLQEQMQDDEFRREYEALQPERAVIQAMIDARRTAGLTQKKLSERTEIAQGDIFRFCALRFSEQEWRAALSCALVAAFRLLTAAAPEDSGRDGG